MKLNSSIFDFHFWDFGSQNGNRMVGRSLRPHTLVGLMAMWAAIQDTLERPFRHICGLSPIILDFVHNHGNRNPAPSQADTRRIRMFPSGTIISKVTKMNFKILLTKSCEGGACSYSIQIAATWHFLFFSLRVLTLIFYTFVVEWVETFEPGLTSQVRWSN